ncbi:MAG: hypothetical protein Q3992_00595 [Bacteroides sp.]|nr:hypothetical protein [Bacteroides sp.]
MNYNEQQALSSFETKLRHLLFNYDRVKERCKELEKVIYDRDAEIKSLMAKNKELEQQYESLKMAKTMSRTGSDVGLTKQKIDALVREIDSCIALFDK